MNNFELVVALRQELTEALDMSLIITEYMRKDFLGSHEMEVVAKLAITKDKLLNHLTKIGEMRETIKRG